LTAQNIGTANLVISGVAIGGADPGDFSIASSGTTCTSSTTLTPGSQCTISIIFKPTASGTRYAQLVITDNAGDSPQMGPLAGLGEGGGTDFVLSVAQGTSVTATVAPGGTASYSLTVTPETGFNQSVSLACSGAPAHATCMVSPSSVNLDGTNSQSATLTVTTTASTLVPPGPNGGPPPPGGFAVSYWWVVLMLLTGSIALALKRRRRVPLLAGAVLMAAIALSCGGGGGGATTGGSNSTGTPTGSYLVTVKGTSGSVSHQATVTLTVH
jgi:large repetitive protein